MVFVQLQFSAFLNLNLLLLGLTCSFIFKGPRSQLSRVESYIQLGCLKVVEVEAQSRFLFHDQMLLLILLIDMVSTRRIYFLKFNKHYRHLLDSNIQFLTLLTCCTPQLYNLQPLQKICLDRPSFANLAVNLQSSHFMI